jgi:hypothetical protein
VFSEFELEKLRKTHSKVQEVGREKYNGKMEKWGVEKKYRRWEEKNYDM